MPIDILLALAAFSFATSITPGPNNLMLLASGVNYGFRRTIPHMIGISAGFAILLVCVGLGLGQVLTAFPLGFNLLKIAGAGYLLFLAWKIATGGPIRAGSEGRPFSFLQAVAFQWVNPKAWVMALSSMTLYTMENRYLSSVAVVVVVFTAINLPCVSLWCGMGNALRRAFSDRKTLTVFNYAMAALLVASLWSLFA